MKKTIVVAALVLWVTCMKGQTPVNVERQLELALQQYEQMLMAHRDTTKFPYSLNTDGTAKDMPSDWWCSGFFGGTLWYLYEYTRNNTWKEAANRWTMALQKEQYNTTTHDLGFMIYCPFGNGYRLTGDPAYKKVLLQSARSLSTRYSPDKSVIKSWDSFAEFHYPVIIDNMMNLDLLFWASGIAGNKKYHDICIAHANATLRNHFRPDHSSYHVVCYGDHGKVLARKTFQGYSDGSAWARGQAWGLYGYTVMYRETKNKKYLQQAKNIADFFIHHPALPEDKIPYWDFNAPGIPYEERDASAGAIACSALLELSAYMPDTSGKVYFTIAEKMLASLSGPSYRNAPGENGNFLLKHSVGFRPAGSDIDVPLIYADYYYIEALLRYKKLLKTPRAAIN